MGTKNVMSDDVACAVKNILSVGKKKFEEFRNSTLYKQTVTLDTPIKQNNFSLFKASNTKDQSSKCLSN